MRICLTGGNGFLGKNVLAAIGDTHEVYAPSRAECDLLDRDACIAATRGVDCIIHLASVMPKDIDDREELEQENLLMNRHLLEAARVHKVKRFIAVGTILSYWGRRPPFTESMLDAVDKNGFPDNLSGSYARSKIDLLAGLRSLHGRTGIDVVYLVLPNLFGKHDSFGDQSHFIPLAIRKILEAKERNEAEVQFHGAGDGKREFLYGSDAAKAIVAASHLDGFYALNIGSGDLLSPREAAARIASIVGYRGKISFPSGEGPDLFMDTAASGIIGTQRRTPFDTALTETVAWYREHRG